MLDALQENARQEIEIPDRGSLQADLEAFLDSTFAMGRRYPGNAAVLRAMMAEAQHDRNFAEMLRNSLIEPRRAALRALLEQARKRGEIPSASDQELIIDIVFGVMWYRLLAGVGKLDKTLAGDLSALIADAMRARGA